MSRTFEDHAVTSMYNRWKNMGKNRGEEWAVFLDFLDDMGIPLPQQVLVRIDREKPFSPGNCVWVSEEDKMSGKWNPNFKDKLTIGHCLCCNTEIEYYVDRPRKYCSTECHAAHDKKLQQCLICGNSFVPGPCESIYHCSKLCEDLALLYKAEAAKRNNVPRRNTLGAPTKKRFLRFCQVCGEKMYLRASAIDKGRKYCSKKCYGIAIGLRQRGDKHHGWKGGVTVVRDAVRKHPLYAEWRKKVFERDKFTCQSCFSVSGKLRAHHMVFYKDDPKLRLKLANGITLCDDCHRLWHVFDRKGVFEGLEKDLQKKCNKKFRDAGFFVFNVHGGVYQTSGIPDSIMCFCGLFVAIEYKIFPNFVTPLQGTQIVAIKTSGGRAYMVNSEDDADRIISEVREATIGV